MCSRLFWLASEIDCVSAFIKQKTFSLLGNTILGLLGVFFEAVFWMHFLSVSLSQGNLILASILKVGHLIDITISVCYNNSRLVRILHILFFFRSNLNLLSHLLSLFSSAFCWLCWRDSLTFPVSFMQISPNPFYWFSHTIFFLVFQVICYTTF